MHYITTIITTILILSSTKAETIISEEMITTALIDTIKRIPENIASIGNTIYKTEIKKEKGYWWYFKENNRLKRKLKEKNIDYHTILKQGMHPKKIYDNSTKSMIKKYAILKALATKNGIEKIKHKKRQKKKLNIIMTDM